MSAAADDSRGDVPDVDPEASLHDEVSEAFRQHVLYFQYTSTLFAGYNELHLCVYHSVMICLATIAS